MLHFQKITFMKKIFYLIVIVVFTLNSCIDNTLKPPPPCYWNQNANIGFKTLSLKYPVKSQTVDIDDEIAFFNDNGRPNEFEYQDYMGFLNDNNYKKDQMLKFSDIFKYNTAFSSKNRVNESQINIAFESLNCSYDTKSQNENYTIDDKSVFEYHARNYQYTNNLKKQYAITVGNNDENKKLKETSATITIKFGPLYDKVSQKMGVITWSKKLEQEIYVPSNSFEATGTFIVTEVAAKKIYIGNKYLIEEF